MAARIAGTALARAAAAAVAAAGFALATAASTAAEDTMAFRLESPAFAAGGEIPARFTCEGEDVSPPLAWHDPPPGTRSFALLAVDPDVPDPKAPRRTWVHWVLYDLPADARALGEGAATALPPGTREGRNDWKRTGYGGPCPPIGRHRYFFRLHALDTVLGDRGSPAQPALEQAIEGHVLGTAELVGTYEKRGR